MYEDRLVRQLHERWLQPDVEDAQEYTVRVEITQFWDVPVKAASESEAYEKAKYVVYNEKWPHNLEMYDEKVDFISCDDGYDQ